jgi:hypothetical protein
MKIKRIVQQVQEAKGMGDIVAIAAEPIKQAVLDHSPSERLKLYIKNCKCDKRREFLNKHFPLK